MNERHLILLSGWGTDATPMREMAEQLGVKDFTALDLRQLYEAGISTTTTKGTEESLSVYAGGLSEIMKKTTGKVDIIGWSTGGIIALELARLFPDDFGRLVLLSSTPKFCEGDDFPYGIPVNTLKAMQLGLRRSPERTLKDFLNQAASPVCLDEDQLEEGVANALTQGKDVMRDGLKYLKDSDYRDGLRNIKCPCLILHGRRDQIIPYGAAQWLDENLPTSDVVIYPEGGHQLLMQYGSDVVSRISAFLEASK